MTPQLQDNGAVARSASSPSTGLESGRLARELGRFPVITAMAFLTLVDLFATQAIRGRRRRSGFAARSFPRCCNSVPHIVLLKRTILTKQ
jgi:hypothetical protein